MKSVYLILGHVYGLVEVLLCNLGLEVLMVLLYFFGGGGEGVIYSAERRRSQKEQTN